MFESCLHLENDISHRSLTCSDNFVQVVDTRPVLQGGAREEVTFTSSDGRTMPRRQNYFRLDNRTLSIRGGFKICTYHDFLKDMTSRQRIKLFYDESIQIDNDQTLRDYADLQIACGDFTTLTANDQQKFLPINQVPAGDNFAWESENGIKDFARQHYSFDHWLKLYRRLDEIDTYAHSGCHDTHILRADKKRGLCGLGEDNRSGRRSSSRLTTIPQGSCPRLERLFQKAKAYWRRHKYRLIENLIRTEAGLGSRSQEAVSTSRSTMVEREIDRQVAVNSICRYIVEVFYRAILLEDKRFLDGESLLRAVVHSGKKETIIATDANHQYPRLATGAAAFKRIGERTRTGVGGTLLFSIRYDSLRDLSNEIRNFISRTQQTPRDLPRMRGEHARRKNTVFEGFKRICQNTSNPGEINRRRDQYCCPPDPNLEDTDYLERFNIIEGNNNKNNDKPPYVVCSRNNQRTTNEDMALKKEETWEGYQAAPYIVPSDKPGIRTVHECVGAFGRPKAYKRLSLIDNLVQIPGNLMETIQTKKAYDVLARKIDRQYDVGIRPFTREVKQWRDTNMPTTTTPSNALETIDSVLPSITEAFNMILLSYDSDAPSFLIDLFFQEAPSDHRNLHDDYDSELKDFPVPPDEVMKLNAETPHNVFNDDADDRENDGGSDDRENDGGSDDRENDGGSDDRNLHAHVPDFANDDIFPYGDSNLLLSLDDDDDSNLELSLDDEALSRTFSEIDPRPYVNFLTDDFLNERDFDKIYDDDVPSGNEH